MCPVPDDGMPFSVFELVQLNVAPDVPEKTIEGTI
jgi:hypothetical protein